MHAERWMMHDTRYISMLDDLKYMIHDAFWMMDDAFWMMDDA